MVIDGKKLIAGYEAICFQSLIADVFYRALFLFVPVIKHPWVIACDAHKTKHLTTNFFFVFFNSQMIS